MTEPDDSIIHLVHTLWSAAITGLIAVFWAVVKWNWNKLNTTLDGKVDRSEMDQLRASLKERWDQQDQVAADRDERQEQQHKENRARMDAIYQLLAKRRT